MREAMIKAMRKAIGSLLLLVLLLVNTLPANGANSPDTSQKYEVYVLNSFSGEMMGTVSDLVFSYRDIGFNYLGTAYSFSLEELDIDTSDGMNIVGAGFYSGRSDNLLCNIVEYHDSMCIQISDTTQSVYSRENDCKHNFTVIAGNNIGQKIPELSAVLNSRNRENKVKPGSSRSIGLHVYVSGLTIPFLVSGGSAEGWCTASDIGNYQRIVTGLSYVIAYNWPSDGVSLWYDYMDSVSAYSSPAWPSSQLTNVSGSWIISIPDGAFVAEATVSALVQGAPLMWTLYDVSYMDGTHQ